MLYDVFGYDVWGNEKDGFEVNDSIKVASIDLPNTEDEDVIISLKNIGFLKNTATTEDFMIEGEAEYSLYVMGRDDYYPYCELRRIAG